MPEFGFWELALIMLVALLIVGPQRLPRLAADAGAWIGRIKKIAQRFKADLAYELNASELEKTIGKPRQEIDRMQKEVQTTAEQVSDTIRALDPLHDTMREQISNSGRYQGDDESLSQAAEKPQTPGKSTTLDSSVAGTTRAGKPQTPGESTMPATNNHSARRHSNNESLSQAAAGKPHAPGESTTPVANKHSGHYQSNDESLSQAAEKPQTPGESTTPAANNRSARQQGNNESLSQAAAGKPQAPSKSTTPAANNRSARRHYGNNESLSQSTDKPQTSTESTTPTTTNRDPNDKP